MDIEKEMLYLFLLKELRAIDNTGGIGDITFVLKDLNKSEYMDFMCRFTDLGFCVNLIGKRCEEGPLIVLDIRKFIFRHVAEDFFDERTLCRKTAKNLKDIVDRYGKTPYRISGRLSINDASDEDLKQYIINNLPLIWDKKNYLLTYILILVELYLDGHLPFDVIKRVSVFQSDIEYKTYLHLFPYIEIWENTPNKDEAISLILLKKLES